MTGEPCLPLQIEMYNTMLEKAGAEQEEEAKKAYIAAREKADQDSEAAAEDMISSALINKVRFLNACRAHLLFTLVVV